MRRSNISWNSRRPKGALAIGMAGSAGVQGGEHRGRIAGGGGCAAGHGSVQQLQIGLGESQVRGCDVLADPIAGAASRDGHDVVSLVQQPGQHKVCPAVAAV